MKVLSGELKPERQLWDEIGQYCKNKLEDWAKCRNNIESLEEWLSYRKEKFEIFIKPFSSILLGEKDTLRSRLVSKYSFDGFRIENVIFESFNGWEVNATVYLPEKEGIYPGIVCPTGSSSKTLRNYQRSAQTFARNGYIAVSFDPPGFSGEKKTMNDIFKFGGRCFLTGLWTTLYTVADALRVLDYLDSREDVDSSLGYTMSGLSLGGFTTNYCSAMDDRIKFFAPVCCLKTYLQKEIIEEHTITASTFGHEYLEAGIDLTDYLCFSAPKPCLIVCGRGDEIFDVFSTSKIYNDVKHIYELYGKGGNIDFFIDEDCGHEFTVKIANKIVVLMNKIIKGYDKPALHLNDEDVKDVDPEYLKCHTSNKVNTFSLNWDEAKRLEKTRTFIESPELERECLRGYAIKILSLNEEDTIPRAYLEQKNVQKVWVHDLQMIDLCIKEDIHIPSILVKRSNLKKKSPALLFIDENGKWESLKQNGPLTRAARFLDRTENNKEPMILSMDLSGWGELRPQPNAYDLASWSNVESSMAFMAIACNKPIMGLRVRDALAGLNYLKNHSDVLEEDIMVGGRGAGAIVALLAALINGKVSKIICIDMLSHYGSIASEYLNCWKDDILIPDILKYFDLPEILAALKGKDILVLNPLDASRRQIEAERAHVLYDRAINGGLNILCGLQEKQAEESFIQFIYR